MLACRECNRGESGKGSRLPVDYLLDRLHTHTEYLIETDAVQVAERRPQVRGRDGAGSHDDVIVTVAAFMERAAERRLYMQLPVNVAGPAWRICRSGRSRAASPRPLAPIASVNARQGSVRSCSVRGTPLA